MTRPALLEGIQRDVNVIAEAQRALSERLDRFETRLDRIESRVEQIAIQVAVLAQAGRRPGSARGACQ